MSDELVLPGAFVSVEVYCNECGASLIRTDGPVPRGGPAVIKIPVQPCRCAVTDQELRKSRLLKKFEYALKTLTDMPI